MTGHTPGPWYADPDDDGLIVADCGPCIGRTYGYDDFPCLDLSDAEIEKFESEVGANARLIAAAPELLEACREFVRKVEAGEAKSTRSYRQMKAAIAKATGAEVHS